VKDKFLKLLETKGDLPLLSDVLISLEGWIDNPKTRNGVSPYIFPMSPNILKILNLSAKKLELFYDKQPRRVGRVGVDSDGVTLI
jgi:hypothetical protein